MRPHRLRRGDVGIDEVDGEAVMAGRPAHLELLLERPFEAVGPAQLHRPQRLIDLEPVHFVPRRSEGRR